MGGFLFQTAPVEIRDNLEGSGKSLHDFCFVLSAAVMVRQPLISKAKVLFGNFNKWIL